jgi:hypothetical protein
MCDTLGRIGEKVSYFAKNSDRSPNEIQVTEFHPRKEGLSGEVQCTYISVPQTEHTHAVLLSRPAWMWGAEMGVNEFGLCIGNEAVFTKGPYNKIGGLTGMDMVRLALERCENAKQALEMIIDLLQIHGQGGNCGFDHKFYYDNAFLIMDRKELYVLETAGKQWAYKKMEMGNISNRLSIGTDMDARSDDSIRDFAGQFTEPVYTTFSGSKRRSAQLSSCLPSANTAQGCMRALRSHDTDVQNPFAKGSVSSACMHYGGAVGDHSTASWVVCLEENRILVWVTGSSLPCVSAFKPWVFGTEPVLPVTAAGDESGKAYWLEAEHFRRSVLGKKIPQEYYHQRNKLEAKWLEQTSLISDADFPAFTRACLEEEKAFYAQWQPDTFERAKTSPAFRSRWEQKTSVLGK